MAVYKVPQDVEADDKLIGPFSFRQFIYLIAIAVSIALAWVLSQAFIGLAIIPLPFILFFGALAWPFRKDQPMEIYLAAMMKFFLKPRMRPWQPEGQVNLVTIVAPRVVEEDHAPRLTSSEAQERLSYLAEVIDTQGWAARGVTDTAMMSLADTVTAEASMANDVLDQSVGIGRQFDDLIEEKDTQRYQHVQQQFQQGMQQAPPVQTQPAPAVYSIPAVPPPQLPAAPPASVTPQAYAEPTSPMVQPYYQTAPPQSGTALPPQDAQPQSAQSFLPPTEETTASDFQPSPDIMRLANNNDLSISAIAREAHRLADDSEEVVVSLR